MKEPDFRHRSLNVNPHAIHKNLTSKSAEQITGHWVQTGLILGLIFLQHHETRPTQDNTIP
jgi:hypothetical protein